MCRILFSLLIVFAVSLSVSAQCNGVYFKETKRQVFSNPFMFSQIEDFDGDGLNDILGYSLTAAGNYQFYYYKRLNANTFDTNARNSSITNSLNEPVFGDVNNDGKKDILIAHPTSPPVLTTYLNDGTGRFLTNTPAVNISSNEILRTGGDINGDGKTDAFTSIYNSGNGTTTLIYRLAQPDNSFGVVITAGVFAGQLTNSGFSSRPQILIEDLNNDGRKDIAFMLDTASGRTLKVLNNTGSVFAETFSGSFNVRSEILTTVDFNNDGRRHFVSAVYQDPSDPPNSYRVKILANNGNNTFISLEWNVPPGYFNYNYYVNGNPAGDFDGDGDKDVVIPGNKKYLLLKNQGSFNFTQQEFKSFLKIDSTDVVDGDGKTDILSLGTPFLDGYVWLQSPPINAIYFLENAVRFRQNVCNPVGQTQTVDFDSDGMTDRAFWNPSTGVWRYYTDNTQNNQVYFQWGSGSFNDVPVPNDYDGDGQTDYAVFRKSDGNWWIYRSSDQQVVAFRFGLPEDKPVPADYDGDGKADFAVFRPSEGNWYVWLSQSNQLYAIHFGIAEDKPHPADYDGDGKADITVFRPSAGTWYRLNSFDNSVFIVQYGVSTDKPIAADFDGDGKANIAVYRDGTWYVLKNDFSTRVFFWGVANDVPFFGTGFFLPMAFVYRRNNSRIYATNFFTGQFFTWEFSTGNSFNETIVSPILPAE